MALGQLQWRLPWRQWQRCCCCCCRRRRRRLQLHLPLPLLLVCLRCPLLLVCQQRCPLLRHSPPAARSGSMATICALWLVTPTWHCGA